jgi:hypothetical protein
MDEWLSGRMDGYFWMGGCVEEWMDVWKYVYMDD